MSIAATLAAARRELAVVHTATCEIRTAATQWAANPSARVGCNCQRATPDAGSHLDYEGGNGYGYTVWFDEPVVVKEHDTVVIVASPNAAEVGLRVQIQQIPPLGSNGLVAQITGVRRDG